MKTQKYTGPALPEGITAKDLEYPSYKDKNRQDSSAGNYGSIQLYHVTSFGWCVATQSIGGRPRNPAFGQRTYGVRLDKTDGVVRFGGGPHVTKIVTVYVRVKRSAAVQKLVDAYNKGAVNAGVVSDRRSSRIAEGQLRRARGERSWYWSN